MAAALAGSGLMEFCGASPQTAGFVGSVSRFIDCESRALGSNAYQALGLPGSTLSIMLSGFLTIFIALIGYNLLLGRSLTVRSGTIAMLKIGAVFALATSWAAYRTMVYDLVVDGPAQIVSDIGRPSAVPGSDGTLTQRLDLADGALVQLSILGPGNPIATPEQYAPPPFAGFNAFALGGSRILFLIAAVAGLGLVRVVVGLMLAFGPFFIAFLMFDSTRSLFEGWVRVLCGAAIAAVGVSIALGFELALLEPWLAAILARRLAGEALPSVPTELFVVTCVFTIVIAGVLIACSRLARAFRLAPVRSHLESDACATWSPAANDRPQVHSVRDRQEQSRAAAVADVLVSLQRREAGRARAWAGDVIPLSRRSSSALETQQFGAADFSVGRSFRRRAQARMTASAGKRDQL
jgi:type IV secretion system protein VirB6